MAENSCVLWNNVVQYTQILLRRIIMWDNKKKAVTFSYDDGVVFDRRLVGLFNRYGLKCTFNLNSGIMSGANTFQTGDVEVRRMNAAGLPELYKGHEIAVHCLTHADLTKCDDETIRNEVVLDKENLERLFGCKVEGMAYPYGTFNPHIAEILKECGIKYARTTRSSCGAATPSELLTLSASMHHSDERAFEYINDFLALDPDKMTEPKMLYIWGHSYEFEVDRNWDYIEEICRMLAGKSDIFYGTNKEVLSPFYGK